MNTQAPRLARCQLALLSSSTKSSGYGLVQFWTVKSKTEVLFTASHGLSKNLVGNYLIKNLVLVATLIQPRD